MVTLKKVIFSPDYYFFLHDKYTILFKIHSECFLTYDHLFFLLSFLLNEMKSNPSSSSFPLLFFLQFLLLLCIL